MSIYKKRIYASTTLLIFILLCIVSGYYYISKKSLHQVHLKEAGTLLNEAERQSFLISENINGLFSQEKIPAEKYMEQIGRLKSSFNSFHEIIKDEVLLFKEGGSGFQTALNDISLSSKTFINQAEDIYSLSQDVYLPGKDFYIQIGSVELELRKDFAGVSNLLLAENDYTELQKNNMKAVIFGTLILSLIITLLLVTPSVRLYIITSRKLENALSEVKNAEYMLRCIIDTSPDLIFIIDNQHKYKMVNKTLAQTLKLSPEDFIGKDDIELGIFKERGETGNSLEIRKRRENESVFKSGEMINIREEPLMINGIKRIHSTTKVPMKDANGNIWGLLGRSQDITDRIKAERVIFESEKKYRHLFIDNPLPMWILDYETLSFLEVNKEAINLYGYNEKEFLSISLFDILPEKKKERVVQIINHIAAGHNSFKKRKTCNHVKKNGENIFVDVDAHMIDFHGKQAFLFSAKDVTGAIELQRQIVHEKVNHQKEITKTVIATQEKERAEIAKELHDNVNQILTSAKLHIECITNESIDVHRKTSIELILSGIQEIRKLSRSIISPSLCQVGLVQSIHELLNHIRLTSFARVGFSHQTFVEENIESDLELTIYRIIQEQTTNILKYAEATIIQVELGQFDNYVQLVITDNGKGFDTTTAHKGVGFTNMMNRAQIHHGDFRLNSSPGNGCSLSINFRLNWIMKNKPLLYSA